MISKFVIGPKFGAHVLHDHSRTIIYNTIVWIGSWCMNLLSWTSLLINVMSGGDASLSIFTHALCLFDNAHSTSRTSKGGAPGFFKMGNIT